MTTTPIVAPSAVPLATLVFLGDGKKVGRLVCPTEVKPIIATHWKKLLT